MANIAKSYKSIILDPMTDSFESQFHLTKADYENTVNFVNWIRYFYIFKEVINSDDAAVMEVGSGNGIVKKFDIR